ncbi:MAG: dioxygenase [Actinobacteria bacterium]|nr:dioxygenase [Actinomycetota bacterium]
MGTPAFDPLHPGTPAGAYDDLLAKVLPEAHRRRSWEPPDGPMPALFVSHGAPPVLDDPQWLDELFNWGQSMPKPRAIVVVSAHWENAPIAISASGAGTPLYYDFGGFHPRYYTLKYATPDASDIARQVTAVLGGPNRVHQFTSRGLDHGAFIPLMAMYPAADVPVVQVSMPSLAPGALLDLGQRIWSLRQEGILVVGSGFMTHSFAVMRNPDLKHHTEAFDQWAARSLADGDIDVLIDYRNKGPGSEVSHPTAEHFVPLLLTLGAATNPGEAVHTAIEGAWLGNSIRSIQVA